MMRSSRNALAAIWRNGCNEGAADADAGDGGGRVVAAQLEQHTHSRLDSLSRVGRRAHSALTSHRLCASCRVVGWVGRCWVCNAYVLYITNWNCTLTLTLHDYGFDYDLTPMVS